VRHVDGGRAHLFLQVLDLASRLDAQLRVQVRQRLIHQEDPRLANEGPTESDPLTLTT
jgi:hypothetical protein